MMCQVESWRKHSEEVMAEKSKVGIIQMHKASLGPVGYLNSTDEMPFRVLLSRPTLETRVPVKVFVSIQQSLTC
jgi:hypothetical protein